MIKDIRILLIKEMLQKYFRAHQQINWMFWIKVVFMKNKSLNLKR